MKDLIMKRNRRLTVILFLVSLIFFALIVRMFFIQVVKAQEYQTLAAMNRTRDIPIPALRGTIFDRNGTKLAFSLKSFSIWTRPDEIIDVETALDAMDQVTDLDFEEIHEKFSRETELVKIKRGLSQETAKSIEALDLKGVWVTEDIQRVYPYNDFAAHVIGHTTVDNQGISGIEQAFDDIMTGIEGKYYISTDASGRQLAYGTDKVYQPVQGNNVILTIDEVIQHYLEKALEGAYEKNQALKTLGIVMDPATGEILAMASKPDYDLNVPRVPLKAYGDIDIETLDEAEQVKTWSAMWTNPLVSSLYEPGSVFKVITASAGLEENVVTPYTEFDAHGYLMVDGVKISCWSSHNPHGHQTLTEGLENSCNPVFMETQMALGKAPFYDYIENFGFTKKTGIALPAEASPMVVPGDTMNNVEAATMSFGQGLSVTPLQMIMAVGAIANDGVLMKPMIVKAVTDEKGEVVEEYSPEPVRQVISGQTALEMRLMMESVVDNGSGGNAKIPGIRVAGKTGTSQKIFEGAYSDDLSWASFTAIVPVDNPELVVLVIVDEPAFSDFGSVVAAPIVREILEDTLRYLGINPEKESLDQVVVVPDFTGMSYSEAKKTAEDLGLAVSVSATSEVTDNHWVSEQFPMKHKDVARGSMVILRIEEVVDNEAQ
ncbi:MAG: hypothetical protein AVO33_02645 [delta proteobacterium ML8_F1]|nr:MAG: hypothetical protein AVO33_02645 [delta proteobacterium ML8_F1]